MISARMAETALEASVTSRYADSFPGGKKASITGQGMQQVPRQLLLTAWGLGLATRGDGQDGGFGIAGVREPSAAAAAVRRGLVWLVIDRATQRDWSVGYGRVVNGMGALQFGSWDERPA